MAIEGDVGRNLGLLIALGSAAAGVAMATMKSPSTFTDAVEDVMEDRAGELSTEIVRVLSNAQEYANKDHNDLSPGDLSEQDVLSRAILGVLVSTENDNEHIPELSDQIDRIYEPKEQFQRCETHYNWAAMWFILSFVGSSSLIATRTLDVTFSQVVSTGLGTIVLFVFGCGIMEFAFWNWCTYKLNGMIQERIFPFETENSSRKSVWLRVGVLTVIGAIFLSIFLGAGMIALESYTGLSLPI